jgi:hypothetical protein
MKENSIRLLDMNTIKVNDNTIIYSAPISALLPCQQKIDKTNLSTSDFSLVIFLPQPIS